MGREDHVSLGFHLYLASMVVLNLVAKQEKDQPGGQALEQVVYESLSALVEEVSALVGFVVLRAAASWPLPPCPSQPRRWMLMKKTWTTHGLSITHASYGCWALQVLGAGSPADGFLMG
jgi:hypothetical protein